MCTLTVPPDGVNIWNGYINFSRCEEKQAKKLNE